MPARVFISYRRDDSAGHAGRVFDRLMAELGRDLLFMDVDTIPLGADFVEVLDAEVGKCDVLLAVIGPSWIDARDEAGHRRLDSDHDFVRIEIASALKRNIQVIPILLEGTRIPRADQLPVDLNALPRRAALDVRHASFHADMDKLVRSLKGPTGQSAPTSRVVGGAAAAEAVDDSYHAEGRIKVEAKVVHGAPDGWFKPGAGKIEWFKDHDHGPEMVVVPAGSFTMGSSDQERERPPHQVTIANSFAVSKFPVTFAEWDAAGISYKPNDNGWGRGRLPVVNVSWQDTKIYADWLSKATGMSYRLLSEAEWGQPKPLTMLRV